VRQLEFSDNLSAFRCDQDDRLGCDDFIHKDDEAKLFQKQRQGITYLFSYDEQIVGYVTLAMSSISEKRMSKQDKKEVSLKFIQVSSLGALQYATIGAEEAWESTYAIGV